MELLATLLWLIIKDESLIDNRQQAIREFQKWNKRKRDKFQPGHIEVAWERIKEEKPV